MQQTLISRTIRAQTRAGAARAEISEIEVSHVSSHELRRRLRVPSRRWRMCRCRRRLMCQRNGCLPICARIRLRPSVGIRCACAAMAIQSTQVQARNDADLGRKNACRSQSRAEHVCTRQGSHGRMRCARTGGVRQRQDAIDWNERAEGTRVRHDGRASGRMSRSKRCFPLFSLHVRFIHSLRCGELISRWQSGSERPCSPSVGLVSSKQHGSLRPFCLVRKGASSNVSLRDRLVHSRPLGVEAVAHGTPQLARFLARTEGVCKRVGVGNARRAKNARFETAIPLLQPLALGLEAAGGHLHVIRQWRLRRRCTRALRSARSLLPAGVAAAIELRGVGVDVCDGERSRRQRGNFRRQCRAHPLVDACAMAGREGRRQTTVSRRMNRAIDRTHILRQHHT